MCRDVWPRLLMWSGALFIFGQGLPLSTVGTLDQDELQAELDSIKQRLLLNLGLSRVPDVSRANVSAVEMARAMEIYRRSVAESLEEDEREDDEEDSSIHRFYSYRDSASPNRTSSWKHLYFQLRISNRQGDSHSHLSVHSAKLRLYRLCKGQHSTASLYQLLEPWNGTESANRVLLERKSSRSRRRSKSRGGSWRTKDTVFELSRVVSNWLDNPALNYGLLLQCSSAVRTRHHQYTTADAVLDILVKEKHSRQKRSSTISVKDLRHFSIHKDCNSTNKTKLCCLYSLTVSFKEIGWDHVIEPANFTANFCRGKCIRGRSSYTSNHALIQSIVNHKMKGVPRPCCAPKKLGSLNILHLNDAKKPEAIVSKLPGMRVKSCGCS